MSIFLVDAFTVTRFAGNRAGVVFDADDYSRDLKQKIAAELNASETVFARRVSSNEFYAEYFTPTTEIDFCGHATIALFHTLAKHEKVDSNERVVVNTKAGNFPIVLAGKSNGDITVTMRQSSSHFAPPPCTASDVAAALRLPEEALDHRFPIGLAKTGNWHLIIGLKNRSFLDQIDYDSNSLSEILSRAQAVTAHVFCADEDGVFHARNFGPTIGIPEDPATGSAAGAFAAYLVHEGLIGDGEHTVKIVQGEKMGRISHISLKIACTDRTLHYVEITGSATISFQLLPQD